MEVEDCTTVNLKKSISTWTIGETKRVVALIFGYRKRNGWFKNPEKAACNNVYNETSFSLTDLFK